MKQKNMTKPILLILISLFLFLSMISTPVLSEQFNTVRGRIFINDEPTNETVEVQLHFSTETLQGISFLEKNQSYYNIGFLGHENETATIHVLSNETLYTPQTNTSLTITADEYMYAYDLYINTSIVEDDNTTTDDNTSNNQTEPSINQPPIAHPGGPYTANEGQQITFSASQSNDSDGTITAYIWNFGDGTTGSGETTKHTYNNNGTYTISLTVTDDDNATDQTTTTATISTSNHPPSKPDINLPRNITVNESFNLTLSSTDTDGDSIKFVIDWDDSNSETETSFTGSNQQIKTSHTYTKTGLFAISVIAVDNNNAQSLDTTQFIKVEDQPVKTTTDSGGFPWIYLIILIIIITIGVVVYYLYKEDKLPISPQNNTDTGESPTIIIKEFFNTKILRKSSTETKTTPSQTPPASPFPTPVTTSEESTEETKTTLSENTNTQTNTTPSENNQTEEPEPQSDNETEFKRL